MKYSFTCPAPCNYTVKVEPRKDEERVRTLVGAGKVHAKQAHPDMPPMSDEQIKRMVRSATSPILR